MKIERQSSQRRVPCAGTLITLAVVILFGCSQEVWAQQWETSGNDISNVNTGKVGVGTQTPLKKLHIFDTNSQVMIERPTNAAGNYALVNFATNHVEKFVIGMNSDSDPAVDKLSFLEGAFSSLVPVMTITGGKLGIGTTGPTEKLQVTGNVKVSGSIDVGGNINAKYQDVAEWVDSSQVLVAGTVVVLDSSRLNHVIASTHSYDSRVAGVISLRPGLSLGEKAEGRVLVATTGRVRIKVDATNGPIQIGDLLVTSSREGFAMKSLPLELGGVQMHRPGTLIGKALEPLDHGTGEILVLLSLQ